MPFDEFAHLLGHYADILKTDPGFQIRPYFFRRVVLLQFEGDPRYRVYPYRIGTADDPPADHIRGLQHFWPAVGPNREPAIGTMLVYLAYMTADEQAYFLRFELPDGRFTDHSVMNVVINGGFPNTVTPMEALFHAMDECNRIAREADCPPIFRDTDSRRAARVESLAPLSVNSRKKYMAFAQALDAYLGDNIDVQFLDRFGTPTRSERGASLGTLNRLRRLLAQLGVPAERITGIVTPWEAVRAARQPAAHGAHEDDADEDYMQQQDALFATAAWAARELVCVLLEYLPGAKNVAEPSSFFRFPLRPMHPR